MGEPRQRQRCPSRRRASGWPAPCELTLGSQRRMRCPAPPEALESRVGRKGDKNWARKEPRLLGASHLCAQRTRARTPQRCRPAFPPPGGCAERMLPACEQGLFSLHALGLRFSAALPSVDALGIFIPGLHGARLTVGLGNVPAA